MATTQSARLPRSSPQVAPGLPAGSERLCPREVHRPCRRLRVSAQRLQRFYPRWGRFASVRNSEDQRAEGQHAQVALTAGIRSGGRTARRFRCGKRHVFPQQSAGASGTERGSPRCLFSMGGVHHMIKTLACACALVIGAGLTSATAAEREQVRMVINLISGVKMPYPENLRNIVAHTERVQLDTNGATVAGLRLDVKIRWCYEHIAPVGNRAEMLRIRKEPVPGLLVGQPFQYVDDFDLDGTIDIGSTTTLEGEPHAPVDRISQFLSRHQSRRPISRRLSGPR